jgi:chromosome segregation ATPase
MNLIVTMLALAAIAVGCKPSEQESTSGRIYKLTQDTKEAAQDMKDYTYAQKAEFVAAMQGQLDALDKDLDQLSAKIESSSDAVKAEAKPKLQALRDQVAQLTKQLDGVMDATESTWDSVKATSLKAFDSLKDGFQQSRQWLSAKIAP